MLAKKSSKDPAAQSALVAESRFTPDEMARLATLRERYQTQPDYGEYGLDLRRLAFARYLVRQGILSEAC